MDGAMKSTAPGLVNLKNTSYKLLKNPIKSHCYMWSVIFACRNHLSFFRVRVRMLWVVIIQLPVVFYVIPQLF
jgi:hypothetical protein